MPTIDRCVHCGFALALDASICPSCQTPVDASVQSPIVLEVDDAPSPPQDFEKPLLLDIDDAPPPPKTPQVEENPLEFIKGDPNAFAGIDDEDPNDDQAVQRRPKVHWSAVASGTGSIQIGLIVLLIAETLMLFGPKFISSSRSGYTYVVHFLNLLIASLMISVISSACFCFGHSSASSAPGRKSNNLAVLSLVISAVAVLLWMGFLGLLIYFRVNIMTMFDSPSRFAQFLRQLLGSFALAGLAMGVAELIFLGLLMRAARILDQSRLRLWSLSVFVVLLIGLIGFAAAMMIGFFKIDDDSQMSWIGELAEGRLILVQLILYVLSLLFFSAYWYVLFQAKWVLGSPVKVREENADA